MNMKSLISNFCIHLYNIYYSRVEILHDWNVFNAQIMEYKGIEN